MARYFNPDSYVRKKTSPVRLPRRYPRLFYRRQAITPVHPLRFQVGCSTPDTFELS